MKDSADPFISGSKLPTLVLKGSNKINVGKSQDSQEKGSASVLAEKDGTTDDRFESVSKEEEEHVVKPSDTQSSTFVFRMKGKETSELESAAIKEISEIQPIQKNDAIITANAQVDVTPGTELVSTLLSSGEAVKVIPAQLPVTDVNNAEADNQERQQVKIEYSAENAAHIQSENTTQEKQSQRSLESSQGEVDILKATQIISNTTPDLIQEKEPQPAVVAQDTIPAHEHVTDTSAEPVVGDSKHCDIMTHSEGDGVLPDNVSLKAIADLPNSLPSESALKDAEPKDDVADADLKNTEQQKENKLFKDQATNVILELDRPRSTLDRESVKNVEVEEQSKEELGKKTPKASDIQTEAVTVCELPKNVENKPDKEPLLLAEKFERQKKDAAVESTDSQSSRSEEPKGSAIRDEAETDFTKPEKPYDLSSEQKCLQPNSNEGQQVVTDALEEKRTEAEEGGRLINDATSIVVDTNHESEILKTENAESGSEETQRAEKVIMTSTGKTEQEPKLLVTKEDVKNDNTNEEDKNANDVKESQTPEMKGVSDEMQDAAGDKKEKSLPDEISNETVESEVDINKANAIANLEQKPGAQKAPEKTTESHSLDTTQELLTLSTKDQSDKNSEEKTETKTSSVKTLENETAPVTANSQVNIQQVQRSIVVEDISKADKIKSTECKVAEVDQEPEGTKVQENQETGTSQGLKSVSISSEGTKDQTEIKDSSLKTLNETANLEICNLTNEAEKRKTEPEHGTSNQKPETAQVLEKTKGVKMDTTQELDSISTDAKDTKDNTEMKTSSVKTLENETAPVTANSQVNIQQVQRSIVVEDISKADKIKSTESKVPKIDQEPEGTTVQENQETGTSQGLKSVSISSEDTKDQTEIKDSSLKTLNETANLEICNLTNEAEKRKTEPEHGTSNQKPETAQVLEKTKGVKMDTTQELDSISTDAKDTKDNTEMKTSSVKTLENETAPVTANSQVNIQQVQRSIVVEDISKADKIKSTESKVAEVDQEPEGTKVQENQEKGTSQGLKSVSISSEGTKDQTEIKNSSLKTLNETANLEICNLTNEAEKRKTEPEHTTSNQKPETAQVLEKTKGVKMDTTQELDSISTDAKDTKDNTEMKTSSVKTLENKTAPVTANSEVNIQQVQRSIVVGDVEDVSKPDKIKSTESKVPKIDQEPEGTKVQENQEKGTSQGLKSVSISSEGTKDQTEIKNSSLKTLNETANFEICNLTKEAEKRKTTESKHTTSNQKPETAQVLEETKGVKMDTTQELDSISTHAKDTKDNTEMKTSSVKTLENKTAPVTANSEVNIQQVQRSIVVGDVEDVSKPDKIKSTESKAAKVDQEPEGTKVQEKQEAGTSQGLKSVSISSEGTKDRTEIKDSSLKTLNETANFEICNLTDEAEKRKTTEPEHTTSNQKPETAQVLEKTKGVKMDTTQELDSISTHAKDTKDNTETNNSSVKSLNAKVSNQQEPETVRTEKRSETQIQEREVESKKAQRAEEPQEKTETKAPSTNSLVKDVVNMNVDSAVKNQEDQKPSVEHVEIKQPEKNTDHSTDSKDPHGSQEQEPKTVTKVSTESASNVSTVVGKSDKIQEQKILIKECLQDENEVLKKEDKLKNTAKIDVKQKAEPIFVKDAASKTVYGKEKDKSNIVSDKILISTDAQKHDGGIKEKLKTDRGLKQEFQVFNGSLSKTPSQSHQIKTDSPSSWLDVEHQQKQKKEPKKRLNASASEDESTERDDFEEFISSINKGGIPFSLPPKRHIRKKSPSPPFSMPAIKEDNFERTFDPGQFKFGLRKNSKISRDPSPAMVIKQYAAKREGRTLEKRGQENALSSPGDKQESLDEVEEKDGVNEASKAEAGNELQSEEPGKLTSRLGRISILSSLLSSPRKTREETLSASNGSSSFKKQQDLTAPGRHSVDSPLPGVRADKEGVKSGDQGSLVGVGGNGTFNESALSSSSPAFPKFSEIKLPDHLDKYLKMNKQEPEASQGSTQMTKMKPNPEGGAVMDQALISGAPNVDVALRGPAALPPTTNFSQKTSQNTLPRKKAKASIYVFEILSSVDTMEKQQPKA